MEDKTFELIEKLYIRMEAGFATVDQRFEQIDQRFEKVDQRFEQIDRRFEQVDGQLGALRQDVARLEHDHGDKLRALFDGYQAHTEAIERMGLELSGLKKMVEKHEVKLKIVK